MSDFLTEKIICILLQILPEHGDCPTCSQRPGREQFSNSVLPERPGPPTASLLLPSQTCPETDQISTDPQATGGVLPRYVELGIHCWWVVSNYDWWPGGLSGKFEIEESLEVMLGVIKLVNDSLHQPNIKGLPDQLFPLGSLVYQETFLVLTIKTQTQARLTSVLSDQYWECWHYEIPPCKLMLTLSPQIFARNTKQKRQVLIYDNYLGKGSKN